MNTMFVVTITEFSRTGMERHNNLLRFQNVTVDLLYILRIFFLLLNCHF